MWATLLLLALEREKMDDLHFILIEFLSPHPTRILSLSFLTHTNYPLQAAHPVC